MATREQIKQDLVKVIKESDTHSCMYQEGIDPEEIAEGVLDYLGRTLTGVPPLPDKE